MLPKTLCTPTLATLVILGLLLPIPSRPETDSKPDPRTGSSDFDSALPASGPAARVVGRVQSWSLDPAAGRRGHGDRGHLWSHEIRSEGAAFLMARLAGLELGAGESLEIRGSEGRVETLVGRGPRDGGAFWTLAVPGDRLELVLRSPRRLADLPFRVEKVASGDTHGGLAKSLCGAGDFEDAACYLADAAKWANIRATAGVMSVEGEEVAWCTGVAVSPRDYVLTTESCLPDTAACSQAQFVFGLYRDGCGGEPPLAAGWTAYRCGQTVAASPFGGLCEPDPDHLDFALHSAEGRPTGTWGYADPSPTAPSSGDGLYIVQHAGGRPLEITHGDGADVVVEPSVLRYYGSLDTESSSVGAPIFAQADDRLVGLHHCGGCSTPGVGNRGVPMADLRSEIQAFLCTNFTTLEPAAPEPLQPVSGNGDAVLDPGETWSFVPTVRNPGCGGGPSITGVSATFAPAVGSVTLELLDTSSSFGTIEAGATALGSPIRFRLPVEAACAGMVGLEMVSITSDSGPFAGSADYLAKAVGEVPVTVLLGEDFAAGLPIGWTVIDGGTGDGPSATWTADDPGSRQLLDPPFAIVDSEHLGPGDTMDESLLTPSIDTTAHANIALHFVHDFRRFEEGLEEKGDVEVRSTATGGAWTLLGRFEGSDASGAVAWDLGPYSAADLQVRFRYWNAEWEWWWALDDLRIIGNDGPICFTGLLVDGFESGDLSAWSAHQP